MEGVASRRVHLLFLDEQCLPSGSHDEYVYQQVCGATYHVTQTAVIETNKVESIAQIM
jgi:hypothetical protein